MKENIQISDSTEQKPAVVKVRKKATKKWITEKLIEIIEISLRAEPVLDKHGEHTGKYVFHTAEALKALELLGKSCGLFSNACEKSDAKSMDKHDVELLKKVYARTQNTAENVGLHADEEESV